MGKSTKAASKLIKFGGIHMSFLQDVLNIVIKYYPQLLKGVGNTMLLALTGTVAGLVIVLALVINVISELLNTLKTLFNLY